MLYNILKRLAQDTGYDIDRDRALLVELAQRAAKELHTMLECNRLNREVTLVVPVNKLVSLPSFVGEIKGVRQHETDALVDVYPLNQPRYMSYTWKFKYKNWRDVGESPVHTLPSSQCKLYFLAAGLETPEAEVIISGHSNISIKTQETVTVNNLFGPETTYLYGPEIYSIASLSARTYDIQVFDDTDVELAVLYANEQNTSYKIIDVSELYQPVDVPEEGEFGSSLIDVAYKVKPSLLKEDADMFFTNNNDYDDAWFYKAMEIFSRPLQGKEAETARYAAACLSASGNDKQQSDVSLVKKLIRGPNKFHHLYNRFRGRYGYRSSGHIGE